MATSDDQRQYQLAKMRTINVVRGLDDAHRATTCPSCPAWSIHEVVAHHVHIVSELATGGLPASMRKSTIGEPHLRAQEAANRDRWTGEGVAARRDQSLDELISEWDAVELPTESRAYSIARLDLTVHLGDILETFGDYRGPDTDLVEATLRQYYDLVAVIRCAEVGDVPVLRCSDTGTRIATGVDAPEIAGSAYELLRAICGRRTRAQAAQRLDWGATAEPVRAAFSVYGWVAE